MSKVVYLTEQPFDARNYDRFGIQIWINRGWDVEVWDLTPVAHPGAWRAFMESGRALRQFVGLFEIASRNELRSRVLTSGKVDYFVDLTGNQPDTAGAKFRLARTGARRVVCDLGSMPEPKDKGSEGLGRRLTRVVGEGPKKFCTRLARRLCELLVEHYVRPSLVVVAGRKAHRVAARRWNEAHILRAHNLDYDVYLRYQDSCGASDKKYALLLDQDLCFHPEYAAVGMCPSATPERYFPAVCKGLREIAASLGVDIVVAAHPRATYRQRGEDYFEGIPVESGRTVELIFRSEVVVAHSSTVTQLAVLLGKPVIFMTTSELRPSWVGAHIDQFAYSLGKSAINVDGDLENIDWRREASVDAVRYAEFIREYVKCDDSPRAPLWDIVIDHIEEKDERRHLTNGEPVSKEGAA